MQLRLSGTDFRAEWLHRKMGLQVLVASVESGTRCFFCVNELGFIFERHFVVACAVLHCLVLLGRMAFCYHRCNLEIGTIVHT